MCCKYIEEPQLLIVMFSIGLIRDACVDVLRQNPTTVEEAYHLVEGVAYARESSSGASRMTKQTSTLACTITMTGWNRGAPHPQGLLRLPPHKQHDLPFRRPRPPLLPSYRSSLTSLVHINDYLFHMRRLRTLAVSVSYCYRRHRFGGRQVSQ